LFILDLRDGILEKRLNRSSHLLHGLAEQREILVCVIRYGVER
jgi:hypothetical protein